MAPVLGSRPAYSSDIRVQMPYTERSAQSLLLQQLTACWEMPARGRNRLNRHGRNAGDAVCLSLRNHAVQLGDQRVQRRDVAGRGGIGRRNLGLSLVVRWAGCGNEEHVAPLRHRQTKGRDNG